jgi:hypothetical protein
LEFGMTLIIKDLLGFQNQINSGKVQVEKMELGVLMIGHQNKDYLLTKGRL